MKKLNLKYAFLSGLVVYIIGINFFLCSYYITLLEDVELQSNIILAIVIIPAAMLGARFYYHKVQKSNGLHLGIAMFGIAAILDAVITVPIFFIPAGGNHYQFFTNPWFWYIALEYVLTVVIYSQLQNAKLTTTIKQQL